MFSGKTPYIWLVLADAKLYEKGNQIMKNRILKVMILTIISITLSHAEFKKNSKNKNLKQATLHVLTITLDKYKNSKFNLLYCNSDADAIAKAFKNNGAKLYKSVCQPLAKRNLNMNSFLLSILLVRLFLLVGWSRFDFIEHL